MSARQVDDLNLLLIGVWRSSFFDDVAASWWWVVGVLQWLLVGMDSSWGRGGRVSSWNIIPIGVCGGVDLFEVLGGLGLWVMGV